MYDHTENRLWIFPPYGHILLPFKPTSITCGPYHSHTVHKHGSCHGNLQVSQSIAHWALVSVCTAFCQSPPLKRDS